MRIIFLFSIFVFYANGATLSEIGRFDSSVVQEEPKKPVQTVEKIKDKICGPSGLKSKVRVTLENPWFRETAKIKYDDINISLTLFKKTDYFGTKINVNCAQIMSSDKFSATIKADFKGRHENYKLNIDGKMNGKSINETGKLKLRWDKIELLYETDADEKTSNRFNNILADYKCNNPTIDIEELAHVIDRIEKNRLYTAIYNIVFGYWEKDLKRATNSLDIKNNESCMVKN